MKTLNNEPLFTPNLTRFLYHGRVQRPPFTALASVYDAIMADIEYADWAEFTLAYLRDQGARPATLLDLACGTGASAAPFAAAGLRVTGLDASPDMLAVARARLPGAEFVAGDLRDFALPGRYDLITCLFDSLNNLTDPADLGRALTRMRAHLAPGGWAAFDLNTRAGVRDLWEGEVLEGLAPLEGGGEVHYHWSHHYQPEEELGVVQAYCRIGDEDFVEVHRERGYDPADLEPLLRAAGFARWEFCEFPDYAPPGPDAARIWVFAAGEAA